MKVTINPKHILGLDILRFAAACLVVAFHYCFLMGNKIKGELDAVSGGLVKFSELYDFTYFGFVGVQIFFAISGFVIAFSGEKSTAFSFLRSRIVRLGPAVWICAPITLVATILAGIPPNENLYRSFRHSMMFVPWRPWIDGSYWTLGIEIAFYAAVLILINFFKFEKIKILAIVIGLASSFVCVCKAIVGLGYLAAYNSQLTWLVAERLPRLLLLRHGMFFAVGVFLWSELIKKHDPKNIFWIILFCITGCIEITGLNDEIKAGWKVTYSAVMPCIIWLAAVTLIIVSVRANSKLHALPPNIVKSIQIIGMMTYPLYLLHQVVGAAMMGWMVLKGIDRWTALAASIVVISCVTWIISTQIEPWLQKWTKYFITVVYEHYNGLRVRVFK